MKVTEISRAQGKKKLSTEPNKLNQQNLVLCCISYCKSALFKVNIKHK